MKSRRPRARSRSVALPPRRKTPPSSPPSPPAATPSKSSASAPPPASPSSKSTRSRRPRARSRSVALPAPSKDAALLTTLPPASTPCSSPASPPPPTPPSPKSTRCLDGSAVPTADAARPSRQPSRSPRPVPTAPAAPAFARRNQSVVPPALPAGPFSPPPSPPSTQTPPPRPLFRRAGPFRRRPADFISPSTRPPLCWRKIPVTFRPRSRPPDPPSFSFAALP